MLKCLQSHSAKKGGVHRTREQGQWAEQTPPLFIPLSYFYSNIFLLEPVVLALSKSATLGLLRAK